MSTQVLHIELPTEIAERIRDHVRSGEYANESEVIAERFLQDDDPGLSPNELDEAFHLGLEAMEEMEHRPEEWLTHDQMVASLEAHRASRRASPVQHK